MIALAMFFYFWHEPVIIHRPVTPVVWHQGQVRP